MIAYLSGSAGPELDERARDLGIGIMIQPGNNYWNRVWLYPCWAADNGAFTTRPGGFSRERFLTMLWRYSLWFHLDTCLFVAAPDVLIVLPNGEVIGDPRATLDQYPEWAAVIASFGFPVALVAQDGLECMLADVPWQLVDVLFIGGSTAWKLGAGARACVDAARARDKRTHMGRVNSYKRLALAQSWGIDSADGTFLKYAPHTNIPRMMTWFERLRKAPR